MFIYVSCLTIKIMTSDASKVWWVSRGRKESSRYKEDDIISIGKSWQTKSGENAKTDTKDICW